MLKFATSIAKNLNKEMNMKTKNRNFLISVVLMGIATMMTACADNDLASQTPIGDKIVGKWYAETPKQVTLGTG